MAEEEKEYEILNENFPDSDFFFKIIVIGAVGVGKSCLSIQATKNRFEKSHSPVAMEFYNFIMRYKEKIIKLQIWDTCGQEIYISLITNYYKSTTLAIIVYAINE